MAIGSVFMYKLFKSSFLNKLGFSLLFTSGFGTILVGIFPENLHVALHSFGAFLIFLFGNLALIILAKSLFISRSMKIYTFLSGAVGLIALIFFISQHYLGIGVGGMERIVAYPQTIWLIVMSVYLFTTRKSLNKLVDSV
jgi:hypothetical membrane protein